MSINLLKFRMINKIVSYNSQALYMLDGLNELCDIFYKYEHYKHTDTFTIGQYKLDRNDIYNLAHCIDDLYPKIKDIENYDFDLFNEETTPSYKWFFRLRNQTVEKILKYMRNKVENKDPDVSKSRVLELLANLQLHERIYFDDTQYICNEFDKYPSLYNIVNYEQTIEKVIEVAKRFIDEYGGVLSGSAALAIYNYQSNLPNKFIPDDIDIFIDDPEVFEYCCMMYLEKRILYERNYEYLNIKFQYDNHLKINLILIQNNKKISALTKTYSEEEKLINHEHFFCSYELERHEELQPTLDNVRFSNFTEPDNEIIKKEELAHFIEELIKGEYDNVLFLNSNPRYEIEIIPENIKQLKDQLKDQLKTINIDIFFSNGSYFHTNSIGPIDSNDSRCFKFFIYRIILFITTYGGAISLLVDREEMEKFTKYIGWKNESFKYRVQRLIKVSYYKFMTDKENIRKCKEIIANKPTIKPVDIRIIHSHIDNFDMIPCRLIWTPNDQFNLTRNEHTFIAANRGVCLIPSNSSTTSTRIWKYSRRGYKIVLLGNVD